MKVSGQLKEASLEVLTEDPANVPLGRVWFDKVANLFKIRKNGDTESILTSGSVLDTHNIGNSKITTAKIADNAIQTAKIGDTQVTTDKIANGAITSAKLAAPNLVLTTAFSYNTASITPTPIATITATTRPISIELIPEASTYDPTSTLQSSIVVSSGSVLTAGGYIRLFRNSVLHKVVRVDRMDGVGSELPVRMSIPVSSFKFVDTSPVNGSNSYYVDAVADSNCAVVIGLCRMLVREL